MMDDDGIVVRTARPLLRMPSASRVAPTHKLPLAHNILHSPLKYAHSLRSLTGMDRSTSPVHNTIILPADQIPNIPDDSWQRTRSAGHSWNVSLPQRGSNASRSVAAVNKVYNADSAIAGVPTFATKLRNSPVKPWSKPRADAPTAALRMARPFNDWSHLGPGSYGGSGVTEDPGRPRPMSPINSSLPRFRHEAHVVGGDAMYDSTALPPFKTSEAHTKLASLASRVPKFSPLPGEQDVGLQQLLNNMPMPEAHNTLQDDIRSSPIKFATAFHSSVPRLPESQMLREIKSRGLSRDAVYAGADLVNTIQGTLRQSRHSKSASSFRSPGRNEVYRSVLMTPGPGTYTAGADSGLNATRPKSSGATILPISSTSRFVDDLPAYRNLASPGIVEDYVLGHRPRSPDKSNRVRLRDGRGHDALYDTAKLKVPDVEYNVDVPGSPAATIATNSKSSSLRYSAMGPGHPKPERNEFGDVIEPKAPSPGRDTMFVRLEAQVCDSVKTNHYRLPEAPQLTSSGEAAVLCVNSPTKKSSFMHSTSSLSRSLTVKESLVAVAKAQRAREERLAVLADERRIRLASTANSLAAKLGPSGSVKQLARLPSFGSLLLTTAREVTSVPSPRPISPRNMPRPPSPQSLVRSTADTDTRLKHHQVAMVRKKLKAVNPEKVAAAHGIPLKRKAAIAANTRKRTSQSLERPLSAGAAVHQVNNTNNSSQAPTSDGETSDQQSRGGPMSFDSI